MTTRITDATRAASGSASAGIQSAGKVRLLYLDNLRTAMIALVVLGHVAISYGAEGDWYFHGEGQTSTAAYILMLPFVAIGAAFMMGLLFFVAGYFTPRSFDRKGAGPFLVDRLKRLGIPLVVFAIIINPLNNYLVDVFTAQYSGPFWKYLPVFLRNEDSSGVGVMWFVEALLIFCIGYVLWRTLIRGRRSPPIGTGDLGPLPGNVAIALFALALGLVTFVVRLWAPVNTYFEPEHLEYAHFPQYIAFFGAGLMGYRRDWLIRFSDSQGRLWQWIALGSVLFLPVLVALAGAFSGELNPDGAGGLNGLSLLYCLWEGFAGVAMSITILLWFRRRFDSQGRVARAMSEASFTAYFLHPFLILCLALVLTKVPLNPSIEFLLATPLAIALCFLVAYYFRKLPVARHIL